MNTTQHTSNFFSAFGLTDRQTQLLYSLERVLAKQDATTTKNAEHARLKESWIYNWTKSIETIFSSNSTGIDHLILHRYDLVAAFKAELSESANKTWYHLVILEAVTFIAYTPLGNTTTDKLSSKLKYTEQINYLRSIITDIGVGSPYIVDTYHHAYQEEMKKAMGPNKALVNGLVVVAGAAVVAAAAALAAPAIAVGIFGANFAGLGGAALANACLAFAGGGALAAGGAGMAGGAFAIAGGGALLGGAGAGAAMLGINILAKQAPYFALSQAAKLSVVLKEIILNEQKDIKMAQNIMQNFKERIVDLTKEVASMKLERDKANDTIKNLEKTLKYMEKMFESMTKFTSAFSVGYPTTPEGHYEG